MCIICWTVNHFIASNHGANCTRSSEISTHTHTQQNQSNKIRLCLTDLMLFCSISVCKQLIYTWTELSTLPPYFLSLWYSVFSPHQSIPVHIALYYKVFKKVKLKKTKKKRKKCLYTHKILSCMSVWRLITRTL